MVLIEENNFLFSGVKGEELKTNCNETTQNPKNVNVRFSCMVIFR
jgi:hypothetical protein